MPISSSRNHSSIDCLYPPREREAFQQKWPRISHLVSSIRNSMGVVIFLRSESVEIVIFFLSPKCACYPGKDYFRGLCCGAEIAMLLSAFLISEKAYAHAMRISQFVLRLLFLLIFVKAMPQSNWTLLLLTLFTDHSNMSSSVNSGTGPESLQINV